MLYSSVSSSTVCYNDAPLGEGGGVHQHCDVLAWVIARQVNVRPQSLDVTWCSRKESEEPGDVMCSSQMCEPTAHNRSGGSHTKASDSRECSPPVQLSVLADSKEAQAFEDMEAWGVIIHRLMSELFSRNWGVLYLLLRWCATATHHVLKVTEWGL